MCNINLSFPPASGSQDICAPWPIQFIHVRYEPLNCVTWLSPFLLHPGRKTSVRHDPFNSFMCGMIHLYVWHDSLPSSCIRVAKYLCAMTQFIHVWHGLRIRVTWPTYTHDTTLNPTPASGSHKICAPWPLEFNSCVVWPIHMCVTWRSQMYVARASSLLLHPGCRTSVRHDSFICMWYDPLICVTWPLHMCDTTLNPTPATGSPIICATWPIDFIHVWYDPFMCVWHDQFIFEWHDPFICVRHESLRYSFIQVAFVRHDSFNPLMCARLIHICVTKPIHMCVTRPIHICVTWLSSPHAHMRRRTSLLHDAFIHLAQLIDTCMGWLWLVGSIKL